MMKTGFGESSGEFEERQMNAMLEILTPVLEKSMLLACEYSKACGRNTVLAQDMEYAIKYCVMYTVGETVGSLFPDIYDEEDSDEEDDLEEVSEDECQPFERYSGDDDCFKRVNEAYDRWDNWQPQSPVEEMLKNAINSNGASGLVGG
jgi:hypothetical protein